MSENKKLAIKIDAVLFFNSKRLNHVWFIHREWRWLYEGEKEEVPVTFLTWPSGDRFFVWFDYVTLKFKTIKKSKCIHIDAKTP